MMPKDAEIIVIGAGPAGLAAAAALADRGVERILIVDRDDEPGGLPRFCSHLGFGWEYTHRLETGPGLVRRLLRRLDSKTVTLLTRTSVLSIRGGPRVEIVSAKHGHMHVEPRAVLLATGIRERPRSARMVPGRRPAQGILTTGQLQQMVARGIPVDGRRALVVGTEHVSFSILLTARHAGLEIVGMVGSENRVMSYAGAALVARAMGVQIYLSTVIDDITGAERVEAVTLRGSSGQRSIACDTVIFSGDFIPDSALIPGSGIELASATSGPSVDQYGRTSASGIFAAGNVLRAVESSGFAAIEGARVGANAATYLEGLLTWPNKTARIRLGEGLAYIVPQRWSVAAGGGYAARSLPISLRALADIPRARLGLTEDGRTIWTGRPTKILRHRRLSLPATGLDLLHGGEVSLRLDPV